MIATPIGKAIFQSRGSYDAAASTLFAAMSSQPDTTRKGHINTAIVALKAAGIWALLDECWFMAAHDSQAGLLGWKRNKDLVAVNAPTFTADRGYAGNGTTSYLNTQFIPSTHGVNYIRNDASAGVYSRTDSAVNVCDFGGDKNSSNAFDFRVRYDASNGEVRVNSTTGPVGFSNANSLGLFVGRRTASNAIQAYKNGSSVATSTTASTVVLDIAFYIGGMNRAGVLTIPSSRQYAFAFVGASMSAGQQLDLFTAVEAYMDAIGAGVI